MRKLLLLMAFSPLFVACGSGDNSAADGQKGDSAKTEQPAPTATTEDVSKGLEIIGSLDCTPACHDINKKIIGPAYVDVAQKYEATPAIIDTLATKIIKGGSGVWGPVPMTPHPTLGMDSARMMVRYILSLRNKQ